jgi:branched-chain amino acid transport system ATP-binding protein
MISAIDLQDIRASYGRIEVLHGIDLSVNAGKFLAVLGPNGAGKSTTLHVAAGLHQPDSGKLRLADRDIVRASARELSSCGVRLLTERRGICPSLSVTENLWLASHTGVSRSDVEERTYTRFPRLAERRRQIAGTLSGGEQQMLALSRVICTNPRLLLLDELSMGLAPMVVAELYEAVTALVQNGVAVVAVEQFASAVLDLADHAVIMTGGRVVASGRPTELADQLAETYLGGEGS